MKTPLPALAAAALCLAACEQEPVTLDPVPYSPLARGTVISWTDAPKGKTTTYSTMVVATDPTYAIYASKLAEEEPEFYVEYYGLYYVGCEKERAVPQSDIDALAGLWPMRSGAKATLSDGTTYTVGEPFEMTLPFDRVKGFTVTEYSPEGVDGTPITSTLHYLPKFAVIGHWDYQGGGDYLLSIVQSGEAPPEALTRRALEACSAG